MTEFVDTYLKSKNREALEALRGFITNMIDVRQGRSAIPSEGVEGDEAYVPAAPAVGDPQYFYTCVRALFPVPAFGEVEACDAGEGANVVGVFL